MALIHPNTLDAVVALGVPNGSTADEGTTWIATGFFYAHRRGEDQARYFLVTNRHVMEDEDALIARLNPRSAGPPRDLLIPRFLDDDEVWELHPGADVGVVGVNALALDEQDIAYGPMDDGNAFEVAAMREEGVAEGDKVFALGFPMGLGLDADTPAAVIVRAGVVARVRGLMDGWDDRFMIDVPAFPGNSGGPVLLSPPLVEQTIQGTRTPSQSALIGVVSGYVPYEDLAVSAQTGEPRVAFTENSGLAVVEPVDRINEVIREYDERFPVD